MNLKKVKTLRGGHVFVNADEYENGKIFLRRYNKHGNKIAGFDGVIRIENLADENSVRVREVFLGDGFYKYQQEGA